VPGFEGQVAEELTLKPVMAELDLPSLSGMKK